MSHLKVSLWLLLIVMGFCSSASKPFRPKQGRVAGYITVWLPFMLQDASESNNNSQYVSSVVKHFTYVTQWLAFEQRFDHEALCQV